MGSIPIIPANASDGSNYYTDSFPLQTYDFRMYVVSLEIGDTLIVNVTSVADGDFDLFLFSTRPKQAYVSRQGYDPEIFNPEWSLVYDNTSDSSFSNISFYANNTEYPIALYYLQVVLINRGPDTYILEANHSMELYFIPFIPGYPTYFSVGISLVSIGILFFYKRKSLLKYNQ